MNAPTPIQLARRFWFVGLALASLFGASLYWWRFHAFVDQYYMPEQPIPFSHRLHAGDMQMPCTYCHFNAERGRYAGVPALSVCLGCHGEAQGVGSDKESILHLRELADATVTVDGVPVSGYRVVDGRPIFADTPEDERQGEDVRIREGGVVHWDRVHLLPDHVYFSHEWHVKAGVACQTCHGPVETMERVYQFSDLSMGWCLECHRSGDHLTSVTGRDGLHQRYDPEDAATYRVGTGDYDALRNRIRPDPVVVFPDRHVAGAHDEGHAQDQDHGPEQPAGLRNGYDAEANETSGAMVGFWTKGQEEQLKQLRAKYPDLPSWRVADLPESHRAFYGEEHLQNAATQCSTCHQ